MTVLLVGTLLLWNAQLVPTPVEWTTTVPPALEEYLRARSAAALRTGSIEWSVEQADTAAFPGWIRYHSGQIAGDDFTMVDWGDEEGVVMRGTDGKPVEQCDYTGPIRFLNQNSQTWFHVDRAPGANVFPEAHTLMEQFHVGDARKIGMTPTPSTRSPYELLRMGVGAEVRYAEAVEAGLHVVTLDVHGTWLRWWIDPERGWNAVRSEVIRDGKTEAWCISELKQFGDAWFPQSIAYYSAGHFDGQQPYRVINVSSATFNSPDEAQTLSPADIGIEAGTQVIFDDPSVFPPLQYWDGERLVTQKEFFARLESGGLQRGPTVQAELERLRERAEREGRPAPPAASRPSTAPASQPVQVTWESAWTAYTRRFIARFRLNEDQTQKAWQILADCQSQAHAYLDRHKDEFTALEQRAAALRELKPAEREKAFEPLATERRRLMAPVDEIFEQRLKPRLDTLPTRAQRRAAHAEDLGSEGEPVPTPATQSGRPTP